MFTSYGASKNRYWVGCVVVGAAAVRMRGMKTALAGFAFFLAAIAFLVCSAVAFDEYRLTAEILPVFRGKGGLTTNGALALLIAVPLCVLCLWAGFSLIGNDNDPPA